MPRTNKKATKIAFKILGKPANMQKQNKVYKERKPDYGIHRSLDAFYNHKV